MGVSGCVRVCVREGVPPRAGEQAAAQEAGPLSPATHSDTQGGDHRAGGVGRHVVLFSEEEHVFSVEHIQTVSFFTANYRGMGRKGNGGREGGGEGDGLLFLNPCQALVLWKFL